jgi:hypothetical protein
MLLQHHVLEKIVSGQLTLVFRRWLRPSVRAGGTLCTPLGVLAIDALELVQEQDITGEDALRAGFADREALCAALNDREGDIYRIAVRYSGADPRLELRQQSELSEADVEQLRRRLARFDAGSRSGPWTQATLRLIARRPAVLAARLAQELERPTVELKRDIRKLKELGLTESLEVGYRLSPRGQRLLELLSAEDQKVT